MVGIISSQAAQSLNYQSLSAQSSTTQLLAKTGQSAYDRLSLSPEAREYLDSGSSALNALGQNEQILQGQRISFLKQQLAELNKQIEVLRGFLEFANADQAGALRTGISDIGSQLERLGGDIKGVVESRSRSVTIEAVQGSFSESFNAAAVGENGALAYSSQLEGDFSFYRITVEEQSTSLAVGEDGSISLQQTTTESEITVSELNLQSSETLVATSSSDPLQELIDSYDATANSFDSLVNDTLEALEINDGGINQLLSFLDEFIEKNRIDLLA